MQLIRELHESINEDSKLIIFCDNKILYDQSQNTYTFEIKDLNPINHKGPFLCIASSESYYIYVLEVNKNEAILGLFMDPNSVNFVDLRQILGFLDQSSFLIASRASILSAWALNSKFCSLCGKAYSFNEAEGAFECSCNNVQNYPSISPVSYTHLTLPTIYSV